MITNLNEVIRIGFGPDDPDGSIRACPHDDLRALVARFEPVYTIRHRFGIEVAAVGKKR